MRLSRQQKADIAQSKAFICLVSPHWQGDPLCQEEARYAAELQKPFLVFVWPGVRLAEDAFQGVREIQITQLPAGSDVEMIAAQVQAWLEAQD
jgi:hypothetical protein